MVAAFLPPNVPSFAAGLLPVWGWAVLGAALGAVAGSFVATLVIRWPAGRTMAGRSCCDGCGRKVGAANLVPLVSFLVLRGRCRSCGARIDMRHLWIESIAAGIGGIAFALAPGEAGLAGALLGWLLLALAVLDLEHFWLPDRLTATLAALGLLGGAVGLAPAFPERLAGGVAGYGVLAAIAFLYARLRGRTGLGRGDPKLLGAIGLWLGWRALPLVLLGASLAGLAAVAAGALAGRAVARTDRVPLGALMAVAAWLLWCIAAISL